MSDAALAPLPTLLNRQQAAEYIASRVGIPISASVLASKAHEGTGPRYRLWGTRTVGRGGRGRYAVYEIPDLDEWIETQLRDPPSRNAVADAV